MRNRLIILAIISSVAFADPILPSKANGYVLQGPHVLELAVEKLGRAERLLVSQELVFYETADAPASAPSVRIPETVRYAYPGAFRSDISSPSAQRIHICNNGKILTVTDGKDASASETWYDRYKDLLLYPSRALLLEHLTARGIDVSTSSLGRFEGKIAYVVGDTPPHNTRSQVWFEKDTLKPIRWIMRNLPVHSDSEELEIRYREWRQFGTVFYPMRIEFLQHSRLVREIRVDSVEVDPAFPKELFDLKPLQSRYGFSEAEAKPVDSLEEVKKTIEEFKRRFE
jgi:outer membrane lipoprotein-sorting protein